MGVLDDLGKGILDGLKDFGEGLKKKLEAKKREYYKNIFFKNVFLNKKYNFDLKVEEDKLTFTNYSASLFFKTIHNSPMFMILWIICALSFTLTFIFIKTNFGLAKIFACIGGALAILMIITFSVFKTKVYFTITPQGIEAKTNKKRVFIDRENIADVYLDIQGSSNEQVVTSESKNEEKSTIFSVYVKSLQPVHLPDLKKDKDKFDLFISDYSQLSKLFIIVLLTEAKRILSLSSQNEWFETGFQNVNILRDDDSVFIFEKKDKIKITVNKYQVKIEENTFLGQKQEKNISIQNNVSFKIFENIKRGHRHSHTVGIGGITIEHHSSTQASSDFGLALCEDFSSNKPNILISNLNLDEAVYILRKMNCLRIGNSF